MRISVLASGSKGNSTFVEEGNTRILIDIGKTCEYIEKELEDIGVSANTINGILITHTHTDHISGLAKFYKKYHPTVYIMPKMCGTLREHLSALEFTYFDKEQTVIDDIKVNIIKTSHDAPDSIGFLLNDKAVYITDTGYLNVKYFPILENKEIYILESNHDLEMLIEGKYPYFLKQRILSDKGHLSNKVSSEYLSRLIGSNTKHIVLAHLSEENNRPKKALETLFLKINEKDVNHIIVAEPNNHTEMIEI